MKKVGCALLIAIPVVVYWVTVYRGSVKMEKAYKTIEDAMREEDRRRTTPKPATLAEAREAAAEGSREQRAADTRFIEELLQKQEKALARKAATQAAGEFAADVKCRAVGRTALQQSETGAWWSVDFECQRTGDAFPNKTSVSVRLTRGPRGWAID